MKINREFVFSLFRSVKDGRSSASAVERRQSGGHPSSKAKESSTNPILSRKHSLSPLHGKKDAGIDRSSGLYHSSSSSSTYDSVEEEKMSPERGEEEKKKSSKSSKPPVKETFKWNPPSEDDEASPIMMETEDDKNMPIFRKKRKGEAMDASSKQEKTNGKKDGEDEGSLKDRLDTLTFQNEKIKQFVSTVKEDGKEKTDKDVEPEVTKEQDQPTSASVEIQSPSSSSSSSGSGSSDSEEETEGDKRDDVKENGNVANQEAKKEQVVKEDGKTEGEKGQTAFPNQQVKIMWKSRRSHEKPSNKMPSPVHAEHRKSPSPSPRSPPTSIQVIHDSPKTPDGSPNPQTRPSNPRTPPSNVQAEPSKALTPTIKSSSLASITQTQPNKSRTPSSDKRIPPKRNGEHRRRYSRSRSRSRSGRSSSRSSRESRSGRSRSRSGSSSRSRSRSRSRDDSRTRRRRSRSSSRDRARHRSPKRR